MKKIVLLLILLLVGFSRINAQNFEKNFIDQPYIEVNGKAEIEVVPDKIYLNIIISEKDNRNKYSIAELDKKFIAALKEIGIDVSKDLLLKDLSSNFKNQFILKDDIVLTKEYELVVHDGKTIGKVARELEKIGISNISIIKTDHSKMDDLRHEVKAKAVKAAKRNAETMALAIDQSIGKALLVQEQFSQIFQAANTLMYKRAESFDAAGAPEPEVDFEKIRLEFTVMARFELK